MRIGVCSDIHSRADRLARVIAAMDDAGLDERWCLGDLTGGGPDPDAVIDALHAFDLVLRGNHDSWLLDGSHAQGELALRSTRQLSWLAACEPTGHRHGIDCWHVSPTDPLDEFLTAQVAGREFPRRPRGSISLFGHTHEPVIFWTDGHTARAAVELAWFWRRCSKEDGLSSRKDTLHECQPRGSTRRN